MTTTTRPVQYVTFYIGGQIFGIDVIHVRDILKKIPISSVPLARPEVVGSLNLRGRIVTVIDMKTKMSMRNTSTSGEKGMMIVVEFKGDLYSLVVDSVGDVLALQEEEREKCPPTTDEHFQRYAQGIYYVNDEVMMDINIDALLDYGSDTEEESA